jgi:TRAP-type mannitol/chloroaromatic compound transport system permease small subunit
MPANQPPIDNPPSAASTSVVTSQASPLTHRLAAAIDNVAERLGRAAAWLSFVLVLVVGVIVVLRYGFQLGSIALQESVMYINGTLFVLGAGYTLKAQGHVRVDVFYSRFSPRGRALVDSLGALLFLLPAAFFIAWISWDYVAVAWRIREGSPEASGLPFVYLLKTLIIVLPVLLAVQGVSELLKSLRALLASKESALQVEDAAETRL